MQLFALFLVVIIIISKYENSKKIIFGLLLICSVAFPALATYIQKLDAYYITSPETYRYLYFKDASTFYNSYLPFYTNISGYIFGFIFGNAYLRLKEQKRNFDYVRWNILWWLFFPVALGLVFSGYWFIKNDFEKPSIWEAVYAGLFRNVFSCITGYFILGLCFKVGWIGFDFLTLPCFRLLGRISHQSYLWHALVIRILAGRLRVIVYVDQMFLLGNVLLTMVFTYVIAYFLLIFWEYPLAEIIRCTLMQGKDMRAQSGLPHKTEENTLEEDKSAHNHQTGETFVLGDATISNNPTLKVDSKV